MRIWAVILVACSAPAFSQVVVHERLREAVDNGVEVQTAVFAVQRAQLDLDRANAKTLPTLTLAAPGAVQATFDPTRRVLADSVLAGSSQLSLGARLPGGMSAEVGAGLDWSGDPTTLPTIPNLSLNVNQRFDLEPGPKNALTAQEVARLTLENAQHLLVEERYRTLKRVVQRLASMETTRAELESAEVAYRAAVAQQEVLGALKAQGRASPTDFWKAEAEVRTSAAQVKRSGLVLDQAEADWRRETGREPWSPSGNDRAAVAVDLAAGELAARGAENERLKLQTRLRWWSGHQEGEALFPSASFTATAKKPIDEPWSVTLSLGATISTDAWVWLSGQEERRRLDERDLEQQTRAQQRTAEDAQRWGERRRARALQDEQDALEERSLARSQGAEAEKLAAQGGLTMAELLGQRAHVARAELAVVAAQWAVVTSVILP